MNYHEAAYWNARYEIAGEKAFDWYLTPDVLLPACAPLTAPLRANARILMLGCGCSGAH